MLKPGVLADGPSCHKLPGDGSSSAVRLKLGSGKPVTRMRFSPLSNKRPTGVVLLVNYGCSLGVEIRKFAGDRT